MIRGIAGPNEYVARLQLEHTHLTCQPCERIAGKIREDRDRPQLVKPRIGAGMRRCFEVVRRRIHVQTLLKYWCTNWIATEPSPTPEATRFIEPWRTSPTA